MISVTIRTWVAGLMMMAAWCGTTISWSVGWASPQVPDGGTPVGVNGSVVNVLPQGAKSILIVNRGSLHGVAVGDEAVHAEGICRVTEVYEHRLKCVIEVSDDVIAAKRAVVIYPRGPRRSPTTVRATVIEVVADEDGASLRLDRGFAHGLLVGTNAQLGADPCQVWQVTDHGAWCFATHASKVGDVVEVSTSQPAGRSLPSPGRVALSAPKLASPAGPPAGVRQEAPPMNIVRGRGHGLFASHTCLGFTPDEQAFYFVVSDGSPGFPPFQDESGLVVERFDFATGAVTRVLKLGPMEAAEGTRQVEALRTSERLLACHVGRFDNRNPDGSVVWNMTSGQLLDHGAGRLAFVWMSREQEGLLAIWSNGNRPAVVVADLASPVAGGQWAYGYGYLSAVYFMPGSPRHLAKVGDRWVPFELALN